MTTPRDIATSETADFVRSHVDRDARLLEVGCGAGDLALALAPSQRVVALDSDAEEVERARARGVDARVVAWPDYTGEHVDAVLFTRSLHHIEELEGAIARAKESLAGQGTILVEDFAYVDASRAARNWIREIALLLYRTGTLSAKGDSFLTRLITGEDSNGAWDEEHHHEHELHTAEAMDAALREHFSHVQPTAVPYLYRYLIAGLSPDELGAQLLSGVLRLETAMGRADSTFWVGRRWVARP